MHRPPFLLSLILLLSACAAPSTAFTDADPYGCKSTLTSQERANCGPHLYEVLDEIIEGDCSYERGAKTRTREDGGGIAFSEDGFQFVDVNGNYGGPHPKIATNTYTLTNSYLNDSGEFQRNQLEYIFTNDGFRARVARSATRGQSVDAGCVTQSTYTLLETRD